MASYIVQDQDILQQLFKDGPGNLVVPYWPTSISREIIVFTTVLTDNVHASVSRLVTAHKSAAAAGAGTTTKTTTGRLVRSQARIILRYCCIGHRPPVGIEYKPAPFHSL